MVHAYFSYPLNALYFPAWQDIYIYIICTIGPTLPIRVYYVLFLCLFKVKIFLGIKIKEKLLY